MDSVKKQYRVVVTREGSSWLAHVPHMRAAQTHARNLQTLDRSVREVIALLEDLPQGSESRLQLEWDFSALGPLAEHAFALRIERERLQQAVDDLAIRTHQTVNAMRNDGWSIRDIGLLVGTSPGRVSQLAQEEQHAKDGKYARASS